jgi:hypothetical protein
MYIHDSVNAEQVHVFLHTHTMHYCTLQGSGEVEWVKKRSDLDYTPTHTTHTQNKGMLVAPRRIPALAETALEPAGPQLVPCLVHCLVIDKRQSNQTNQTSQTSQRTHFNPGPGNRPDNNDQRAPPTQFSLTDVSVCSSDCSFIFTLRPLSFASPPQSPSWSIHVHFERSSPSLSYVPDLRPQGLAGLLTHRNITRRRTPPQFLLL